MTDPSQDSRHHRRRLTRVWLLLLGLTGAGALLADAGAMTPPLVLLVCATATVKGKLVIDRLIGLAGTARPVHWSMLSYFYLLPPLIAVAWLFPDVVARLTTL